MSRTSAQGSSGHSCMNKLILIDVLSERTCWRRWRAALCGHRKASPPPERSHLTSPYCSGSEDLEDTWPEKLDVLLSIIKKQKTQTGCTNLASLSRSGFISAHFLSYFLFPALNTRWRYVHFPFFRIMSSKPTCSVLMLRFLTVLFRILQLKRNWL